MTQETDRIQEIATGVIETMRMVAEFPKSDHVKADIEYSIKMLEEAKQLI